VTKHFNRVLLRAIGAVVLVAAPAQRLTAQTNDEARLILGIAVGYVGAVSLWDIPNQPIFPAFGPPDLFHLRREMHSDVSVSGHATYFSGPHLGVTGEFTYLGLGTTDGCELAQDNGNLELAAMCDGLKGKIGTASTTVVNGGVVYRPFSRTGLQPYFKGMVGLAFTPSSTIAMRSEYGAIADTSLILTVYQDAGWKSIRPSGTLAFGISTAPSSGYQIHAEVRETWMGLGVVTGPTSGQGFVPPSKTSLKGFTSVLVGFDVVLAKQRGRRY